MTSIIDQQKTADAEYLRTVMPVLKDYVKTIVDGAELDRLKAVAERTGAVAELPLINALIAVRDAVTRKPAATAPPEHTQAGPAFVAYSVGMCSASVCTSLTDEEATQRLNASHPTGISSRWRLPDEPLAYGERNGRPCPDRPQTHRHLLFHC